MEPLSRNEKITQIRRNNKKYRRSKLKSRIVTNSLDNSDKVFKDTSHPSNRSFQLRLAAASLLFLLFLGVKETSFSTQMINYDNILEIITDNSGMEQAEKFVIATFYNLD